MIAAIGVAMGLRNLRDEQIPKTALMSAAIFIASVVIRLPLGPSNIHPLLNGLAGILLGWAAIPAFLVTLFLQALLFQFGGITTLGINTITMGLPAVLCYYLFGGRLHGSRSEKHAFFWGVAAGSTALLFSFVLWASALVLCGKQLGAIVKLAVVPHIAIVIIEGLFTGFVASFLVRVYPSAFETPWLVRTPETA